MLSFLGWVLVAVAVGLVVSALRKSEAGARVGRVAARRPYLLAAAASLVVGLLLAFSPAIAAARLERVDLTRKDDWRINPAVSATSPIHWEGGTLVASLEAGSGHYAVFPVDWNADRFVARWEITFTRLDLPGDRIPIKQGETTIQHARTERDFASVAIGMMDQGAANIDDHDHVSGSAIQACFSNDIRLRASDANFLLRTASSTESGKADLDPRFKQSQPVKIALNQKYRCELAYGAASREATLAVQDGSGKLVVSRRLDEVKDLTNSVAWIGVSVRGYNRFDKRLEPKHDVNGYVKPRAVVRIENLEYFQP